MKKLRLRRPHMPKKSVLLLGTMVSLAAAGGFAYASTTVYKPQAHVAEKPRTTQTQPKKDIATSPTKTDPKAATKKPVATDKNHSDYKTQLQNHSQNQLARAQDRVKRAVETKKLTQAQADKILAQINDMSDFLKSTSSQPLAEQHKAVMVKRTELRDWAKQNKIPYSYVAFIN